MSGAIVGITVAYVALAVLLLSLNIYSRWPPWVKIGAVALTGLLYFVTYTSLESFLGWPARAALPQKFMMLAGSIDEPDEETGSRGVIHIWAVSLEDDRLGSEPRAYRVPYSRQLHGQVGAAMRQLRDGIVQVGEVEEGVRRRASGIARLWVEDEVSRILIYDLPAPELPDK